MISVAFQIASSGSWAAFGSVEKPFEFEPTISANTQAAWTVNLTLSSDTAALLPGQICRMAFGTSYVYGVITDGGNVSGKGAKTFYRHTYTVQELLCYTREIKIQQGYFSHDEYTLAEFLARLVALCDSDTSISFSTGGGYATMLANWQNADYQITSSSLLDNLVKIGQNLGVRFTATYTASSNTLTLSAVSLKGSTTITSISGTLQSSSNDYKGSNYAGKVSAVVENMAGDQFKWWPSYSFVNGARGVPSDEYKSETSQDDICLVLPHNIRDASVVRVMGFADVITDSDTKEPYAGDYYKIFNSAGTEIVPDTGKNVVINTAPTVRNTSNQITEYNIVEYAEWLLLDETGTGSQADTLYFKRGENKIYNLKVCNGTGTSANSDWVYEIKIYNSSWVYQSSVYRYQTLYYQLNYYSAYVNLFNDGELVQANALGTKRTAFYSQEENQVSGKALASNMQGYIDSMANGEYSVDYVFTAYASVPALGSIYNGQVLHSIAMSVNNSFIAATLKFSDDLVPKSEYLTADTGVNLPAIPLDKAYDRFTNYEVNMWFCSSTAQALAVIALFGADTYFDHVNYADNIFKGLENGKTSPPLEISEIFLRTGDDSGTYVYTALAPLVQAIGHSFILNFRTVDNRIVGRMVDETGGTAIADLKYYPINFINSTGKCTGIWFKTSAAGSVASTETNYPAIASSVFTGATNPYFSIQDTAYYHDKAERPNITVQMNAKVYGGAGKVYQAFWEETPFFKDCFFESDLYTRYLTINGGAYIEIADDGVTVTKGDSSNYLVGVSFATGSEENGTYPLVFYRKLNSGSTYERMFEISGLVNIGPSATTAYFTVAFTK